MHPVSLIALCVGGLAAGDTIQLLPAGEFRAWDGRPAEVRSWRIDAASARAVIAAFASKRRDIVVDYEHQTLFAANNGQPAPAAGWITQLEWREGGGLYATVRWTERAKAMIASGEYRFISPVFAYAQKDGTVLSVLHAALTNNPALDALDEVHLKAAASLAAAHLPQKETSMTFVQQVIAALSLAATATEDEAIAALRVVLEKAGAADQLETEIAALRAQAPDPAQFAPVAALQALQGELAALKAQLTARDVDELVRDAVAAAKLLPAQEPWARDLGAKDIAALRSFIETAPAIPALKGTQTGGAGPAGGGDVDAAALSAKAVAYQAEQSKLGRVLNIAEAVAHVKAAG